MLAEEGRWLGTIMAPAPHRQHKRIVKRVDGIGTSRIARARKARLQPGVAVPTTARSKCSANLAKAAITALVLSIIAHTLRAARKGTATTAAVAVARLFLHQ